MNCVGMVCSVALCNCVSFFQCSRCFSCRKCMVRCQWVSGIAVGPPQSARERSRQSTVEINQPQLALETPPNLKPLFQKGSGWLACRTSPSHSGQTHMQYEYRAPVGLQAQPMESIHLRKSGRMYGRYTCVECVFTGIFYGLNVFVWVHDAVLFASCQQECDRTRAGRLTGSYKCLICRIKPIKVSLLLYPM